MIVPMKKATILAMTEDRAEALEELRELGVVHVDSVDAPAESAEVAALEREVTALEMAVGVLKTRKPAKKGVEPADFSDATSEEIAEMAVSALADNENIAKRLEALRRDREKLHPWGDFSRELVDILRDKGVFIYLCVANEQDKPPDLPEGYIIYTVRHLEGKRYFVVLGDTAIDESQLPLAVLPAGVTLSHIEAEIRKIFGQSRKNDGALDTLKSRLPQIEGQLLARREAFEFAAIREGMGTSEGICYLRGYVPATGVEALRAAAAANGWGIQLTEPGPEDDPPTLIKTPKPLAISKPIFDFIGISPGYREWDVSPCFLLFFTVFFGMIVGDAGYGTIFLALALFAKFKFKSPAARLPVNLFIILSLSTLVWGGLTANYFGIPVDRLPTWMRGVPALASSAGKDKNVQYICFLIAACHLSFARLWQALIALQSKRVGGALGQVGWGMLIWGNFFTAAELIIFPGSFPKFAFALYGLGLALILVFGVKWNDVGEVLNFPFNIIGSFVDVLSYIRLFAVGLSTFYIANSFNNMGMMVFELSPWLVVGTVVIILFGHVLNILLAFMGVLVHGIRLNTLEFSNHMQLSWAGYAYRPFKRLKDVAAEDET